MTASEDWLPGTGGWRCSAASLPHRRAPNPDAIRSADRKSCRKPWARPQRAVAMRPSRRRMAAAPQAMDPHRLDPPRLDPPRLDPPRLDPPTDFLDPHA